MRGTTKITLGKASVLEAIQEYFDARIGDKMPKQKITNIEKVDGGHFDSSTFEVSLEEVAGESK